MSSRLSALLVWALVTASAVFWAFRLSAAPLPVPEGALLASQPNLASGDLSALLGASAATPEAAVAAAPPPQSTRFRLTGVVATAGDRRPGSRSAAGVALISTDGSPPRAYRVGDMIDSSLALHSVALRSARITDRAAAGGIAFVLELPPPAPAATGRPATGAGSGAGASAGLAAPSPNSQSTDPAYQGPESIPQPAASIYQPPSQQAAGPNGGGMAPSLQMTPGFEVQGLPQGVQLQPPASKRSDEQSRSMRQ